MLPALIDMDQGGAGLDLGRTQHIERFDAFFGQARRERVATGVRTNTSDKCHARAESGSRHRLVEALAAGELTKDVSPHVFTSSWQARAACNVIGVGAADHQDVPSGWRRWHAEHAVPQPMAMQRPQVPATRQCPSGSALVAKSR